MAWALSADTRKLRARVVWKASSSWQMCIRDRYRNLTPAQLVEHALRRGEGTLSNTGALVVKTGKYTGRSANDKFIVDTPAVHDDIAWGKVNRPFEKAKFDAIRAKVPVSYTHLDVYKRQEDAVEQGSDIWSHGVFSFHGRRPRIL